LEVPDEREAAEEIVQLRRHLLVELKATLDELLPGPLCLLDTSSRLSDLVSQNEQNDRSERGNRELGEFKRAPLGAHAGDSSTTSVVVKQPNGSATCWLARVLDGE